eukprot:404397-Pleurochrysis_carterae.AAC.1
MCIRDSSVCVCVCLCVRACVRACVIATAPRAVDDEAPKVLAFQGGLKPLLDAAVCAETRGFVNTSWTEF